MGHLALEAPRHEINSFINKIDKNIVALCQGTQVGKYGCRTLEAPRHESNICVKEIGGAPLRHWWQGHNFNGISFLVVRFLGY